MSDIPRPTWEPLAQRCGACGHEWDDWQPNNVPADTWIAHLRTFRCPKGCAGEGRLFIRFHPLPAGERP